MACLFINLCISFWIERGFIKHVHTVQITRNLRIKDNASACTSSNNQQDAT